QAAIEPRVGGGFTVTTACPDGGTFAFKGRYTAVEVCTRLAFDITWEAPMGYDVPHERATVEFAGDGAGTTMTFVHDGVPDGIATATHEAGWRDTFALLERVLAE
ncbi:MAG: SRPBCC domain-containing protein, partial [Phycisphaerales bacterium]|nr:SRPBCC domain-containing protein [Phycisphaerales bacterium]